MIAPLWTDLEVGGAAGGALYYDVLFDGVDNWLILEWNDVYLWNTPDGPRFTFSVWIKLGTDEIYYNYLDIPVQLNFATVGIEDVAGTAGTSAYFNGTGTYPATGEAWQALLQPGDPGFVEFEYDVVAETFGAASDTSASTTRNGSVTVDLSEQFTTSLADSFSLATVDSPKGEFRAVAPVLIVADGEVGLEIVDEPANGTVSPAEEEFTFVYTPTPGFFGTDSFSFQAVDAGGNVTNVASVNVAVVNRAPVARASGPLQVRGKAEVTLSAAGSSDPDGDALTYSWAQTGGTPVTLSGANTATATFTAPNRNEPVSFTVTVSDGDLSSTASVSVNVVKRSSDTKWYEGSFGTFLALLGLCVAWVRRRSLLA